MITYHYVQTVNGKTTEFEVTGENIQEVFKKASKQLKTNEIMWENSGLDVSKYDVVNNPDGTITLKPKEKEYTLRDVENFVAENVSKDMVDKADAMFDLYQTSLFTNSLFDNEKEYIFTCKKGSLNVIENALPYFHVGETIFTSKPSIELALKILGEETIKKALQ